MNTHFKSLTSVAIILIGALTLRGEEFVNTIEKTFPISEGGKLTTNLVDADITVSSHDKAEVYVHITRKVKGKSEEEAQEIFAKHIIDFESEPDSLTIITKREDKKSKLWNFRRGSMNVNFQIRVPRQLHTHLKTVDGDVRLTEVAGNSTVNTVDGDLKVSNVAGKLNLKTVDGDVNISHLMGPLVVRSVDGDLALNNIQGSIQAKTVDGDVAVELTGKPEGNSSIESTDGDIALTLTEGVGVTIDAKASDGTVHLPFVAESIQKRGDTTHIVASAHGGGPQLVLRTRDGDIVAQ